MSKRGIAVLLVGIVSGAVVGGTCGALVAWRLLRTDVAEAKGGPAPNGLETAPTGSGAPTSGLGPVDSEYPQVTYALDGYCPVTMVEDGKWVPGDALCRLRRGTHVYLFASPTEMQQFLKHPERYAPAFSGNDLVLALDNGETVAGKREHGLTCRGRIYLFATEESLQRFMDHPEWYVVAKGE